MSVTMCVVFQRGRIKVFSMAESQAKIAQKTWELTNNIMEVRFIVNIFWLRQELKEC